MSLQSTPFDPVPPTKVTDWSSMVSFTPPNYYLPTDLTSLQAAVREVVSKGLQVSIPASKHSCSEIIEGMAIIDLSAYPKQLQFADDESSVTASANYVFQDFLLQCSKYNKSLRATGGVTEQFLSGLISTNTAPATSTCTIYQDLEWVEYLVYHVDTDTFEVKTVERGDPEFLAVVCSVGALGVLLRVRFALVDQPFFTTLQEIRKMTDVLADLDKTTAEYEFWRIDWIPNTDNGLFWGAKRIPQSEANPNGTYPTDLSLYVLLWALKCRGYLLTPETALVYGVLEALYTKVVVTGPLRTMLPVDMGTPLRVAMAEWAFNPADRDRVLACCRTYFMQHGWPNIPVEIELTKTDPFYLSPWNWKGLDYIVKFNFMFLTNNLEDPDGSCGGDDNVYRAGIKTYLKGLWDALIAAGIPFKAHWGKINFMDQAFVKANYEYDQFKPYIQAPFLNAYLKERFDV